MLLSLRAPRFKATLLTHRIHGGSAVAVIPLSEFEGET
jgi:hypothetical protein